RFSRACLTHVSYQSYCGIKVEESETYDGGTFARLQTLATKSPTFVPSEGKIGRRVTPRSTSCISCRIRRGMGHCGPLCQRCDGSVARASDRRSPPCAPAAVRALCAAENRPRFRRWTLTSTADDARRCHRPGCRALRR